MARLCLSLSYLLQCGFSCLLNLWALLSQFGFFGFFCFFVFLVAACGLPLHWELPALGAWSLNHWTTREVPRWGPGGVQRKLFHRWYRLSASVGGGEFGNLLHHSLEHKPVISPFDSNNLKNKNLFNEKLRAKFCYSRKLIMNMEHSVSQHLLSVVGIIMISSTT